MPASRRNEVMGWVTSGLKDFSLSRSKVEWGIRVPWDASQTFYVWTDALMGYLTGLILLASYSTHSRLRTRPVYIWKDQCAEQRQQHLLSLINVYYRYRNDPHGSMYSLLVSPLVKGLEPIPVDLVQQQTKALGLGGGLGEQQGCAENQSFGKVASHSTGKLYCPSGKHARLQNEPELVSL